MVQMEEWIRKACEESLNDFEIVYERNFTKDFVEVMGNIGGEVLRIRYYKNGTKGEK